MAPYNPDFDLLRSEDILNNIKAESHKSAYKLCEYLHNESVRFKHNIATAESLTGGLIFSTLVDIPFYGYLKYGCFSVYDTDAKRIMLGVNVEDVNVTVSELGVNVLDTYIDVKDQTVIDKIEKYLNKIL
jgi:hypothetical protein